MNWLQRIITRGGGEKALSLPMLPFNPPWRSASFVEPDFAYMTRQNYNANAAVYICVTALALAYQQPRPVVKSRKTGELLPKHPLQALLDRPNPMMSWHELALYIMVYRAIGGSTLLAKIRKQGNNRPYQLWPHHVGNMLPVSGEYEWISHYEYNIGGGVSRRIEKEDIIHLKWPSIDHEQPWLPMPPLRALMRETATDSEASQLVYTLLMNDATPRTVITLAPGVTLSTERFEQLRQQFNQRHNGRNRGGVGLLEGGATMNRIAFNLQELDLSALRRIPEHRISSGLLVPPEYSGLTAGLEHNTYNNKSEARTGFYQDTIVPICDLDAGELTSDLAADFDDDVIVAYDYSGVVALREDDDKRSVRVRAEWKDGLRGYKESRRALNLPDDLPDDDWLFGQSPTTTGNGADSAKALEKPPILGYHIETGSVKKNEVREYLQLPPLDESEDERARVLMGKLAIVRAAVEANIDTDNALALAGLELPITQTGNAQEPPQVTVEQVPPIALLTNQQEEQEEQGAKAAFVVRVGSLPASEDAEAIAEELPTLTGRAARVWDEVMPEVAGLVEAEGE